MQQRETLTCREIVCQNRFGAHKLWQQTLLTDSLLCLRMQEAFNENIEQDMQSNADSAPCGVGKSNAFHIRQQGSFLCMNGFPVWVNAVFVEHGELKGNVHAREVLVCECEASSSSVRRWR